MYGIGIDTGGTCTDAVIYDFDKKEIVSFAKSNTTHQQLEIGIGNSIRKLPKDLINKAEYISLSTTLATNACVENKGGRVCLIFIGDLEQTVRTSYDKYGFDGTDFMRFIPADAKASVEPDWNILEEMLPSIFEEYDSIAISQLFAKENDGAYEKEAKRRILAHKDIPVVCAYEIFTDYNAVKRGAGALLNARLIPVIEEFFKAVQKVLDEENITIPFMIMRSDGSLVSQEYSLMYPVETLLCGPTASAKGAAELFDEKNAIVIDMGGTTSDIALIKNGNLKIDNEGVKVGKWHTFVRGIDIDTFALGGDTHVCYKDENLYLENRRVMPVSMLANSYPDVLADMAEVTSLPRGSAKGLYEHFLLMKTVEDRLDHYNREELNIIEALKNGPLSLKTLAETVGKDHFTIKTERLETEGVILRSGFTPTDAIILRRDRTDLFGENGKKAAQLAATFIAHSTGKTEEVVIEETYRIVKERLYCNLVRILWSDSRTNLESKKETDLLTALETFSKISFDNEYVRKDNRFFSNAFMTDAVLLGVGAPTYEFLDDVAKALHTTSKVSEFSGVSNALGAVLGDVCAIDNVDIRVDYAAEADDNGDIKKHVVYANEKIGFVTMEEAVEYATSLALKRANDKAMLCGAKSVYDTKVETKMIEGHTNQGTLLMGATVTATAHGNLI